MHRLSGGENEIMYVTLQSLSRLVYLHILHILIYPIYDFTPYS